MQTRFQHALGSMHLTGKTLHTLQSKGVEISDEEFEATQLAVLLHDIGHGPFSHSLEEVLMPDTSHESLSYQLINELNKELNGSLELSLKIFRNGYERRFFHELVNSQLDMDRLDYLYRDSYFTGVPEGRINVDRIIQLLNVVDDKLVAEEKALYTIENFLNARRLMYWQVYLHKTSLGADRLLVNLITRARDLSVSGEEISGTNELLNILKDPPNPSSDKSIESSLKDFGRIDDYDVIGAIKFWTNHSDQILATLSQMFLNRKIFKVKLSSDPINKDHVFQLKKSISDRYNILNKDSRYFISYGKVTNEAYLSGGEGIHMLKKSGQIVDIADAADLPNIQAMSKLVSKYYICRPKNL
jgi:HD superfamily phosphohydrolase